MLPLPTTDAMTPLTPTKDVIPLTTQNDVTPLTTTNNVIQLTTINYMIPLTTTSTISFIYHQLYYRYDSRDGVSKRGTGNLSMLEGGNDLTVKK